MIRSSQTLTKIIVGANNKNILMREELAPECNKNGKITSNQVGIKA